MKPYYTVRGSSEIIAVDHNGIPLEIEGQSIMQFNTAEYAEWCRKNGLELSRGATIDILVLGYWHKVEDEGEFGYQYHEQGAREDLLAVLA